MRRRYQLRFEYLNPLTGMWECAHRECEQDDLPGLISQMDNQSRMTDVRNSRILVQTVSDWRESKL